MPLLHRRPDGTRPSLSFFSQRSQNAEACPLTRQTPRSIPSPGDGLSPGPRRAWLGHLSEAHKLVHTLTMPRLPHTAL